MRCGSLRLLSALSYFYIRVRLRASPHKPHRITPETLGKELNKGKNLQSLTSIAQQIDRRVKGILRAVDLEQLTRDERELVKQMRLACNEIRLDVRDYEYAQTRVEQTKWIKIARHNMKAFETILLSLGDIFGPADVAELSAHLHTMEARLV